ncbi:hypothetical protein D1007_31563 [Hordeum vulgare]|nr:hypothetical protein D1007_31563 [Hordeum vulgare]
MASFPGTAQCPGALPLQRHPPAGRMRLCRAVGRSGATGGARAIGRAADGVGGGGIWGALQVQARPRMRTSQASWVERNDRLRLRHRTTCPPPVSGGQRRPFFMPRLFGTGKHLQHAVTAFYLFIFERESMW